MRENYFGFSFSKSEAHWDEYLVEQATDKIEKSVRTWPNATKASYPVVTGAEGAAPRRQSTVKPRLTVVSGHRAAGEAAALRSEAGRPTGPVLDPAPTPAPARPGPAALANHPERLQAPPPRQRLCPPAPTCCPSYLASSGSVKSRTGGSAGGWRRGSRRAAAGAQPSRAAASSSSSRAAPPAMPRRTGPGPASSLRPRSSAPSPGRRVRAAAPRRCGEAGRGGKSSSRGTARGWRLAKGPALLPGEAAAAAQAAQPARHPVCQRESRSVPTLLPAAAAREQFAMFTHKISFLRMAETSKRAS